MSEYSGLLVLLAVVWFVWFWVCVLAGFMVARRAASLRALQARASAATAALIAASPLGDGFADPSTTREGT